MITVKPLNANAITAHPPKRVEPPVKSYPTLVQAANAWNKRDLLYVPNWHCGCGRCGS